MSLPAGLISLPCEGAMHVSCWVGSNCSGMAGQILHGGTTCFQHILLAPACPSCMDMAPWPTSRNFPPVPWSHLGGPGAPFVPLAASPEGWAWFDLKPQSSIALGPNMDWLSLGGYRTKTITLVYLRKSLGYQVKHFPPPDSLCAGWAEICTSPKSWVGGEDGQKVTLRRGIAVKNHKQNPELLLPGSHNRCAALTSGLKCCQG